MARILNTPEDIAAYPENQIVRRRVDFSAMPDHPQAPLPGQGGVIIEARWGVVYEKDEHGADTAVEMHPAEAVSFAEDGAGGWAKATALRLD